MSRKKAPPPVSPAELATSRLAERARAVVLGWRDQHVTSDTFDGLVDDLAEACGLPREGGEG